MMQNKTECRILYIYSLRSCIVSKSKTDDKSILKLIFGYNIHCMRHRTYLLAGMWVLLTSKVNVNGCYAKNRKPTLKKGKNHTKIKLDFYIDYIFLYITCDIYFVLFICTSRAIDSPKCRILKTFSVLLKRVALANFYEKIEGSELSYDFLPL